MTLTYEDKQTVYQLVLCYKVCRQSSCSILDSSCHEGHSSPFTCVSNDHCRLPKCYGKRMREKMRAGPGCEDLKVRSPYFYSVAAALHPVIDSDTLATFVNTSFRDRYQVAVMPPSCNC